MRAKGDSRVIEKEANLGRSQYRNFWLIVRDEGANGSGPQELLTLGTEDGARTLPVFSFEDEALLYLRLAGLEGSWRVSETVASALVSALCETYRDVQGVVLDPFPEAGFDGFYEAVSLRRDKFLHLLALPH